MIRITFVVKDGKYVSFESDGHAYYDEIGYDIVCAAVSALTITAVNALEAVAKITPIVDMGDGDGYLYCGLPEDLSDEQWLKSGVIFETVIVGLKDIENTYSDHIHILYEEVTKDD